MRVALAAGLGAIILGLAAAPALALSCMFLPFHAPGERFGTKELVAHVEVLEVRPDRTMDVRIVRVFHGREERPLVTVDAAPAIGWDMPRQWGFTPFKSGTQSVIVMLRGREGHALWQPQLCRANLKVLGSNAEGYVSQLGKREHVALDVFALSQSPGPQSDLIG